MMKIFILIFLIFTSVESRADLGELYGFGSSTAALAGANRAKSYDAFTIQRNPALMSFSTGNSLTLGFLGAIDKFQDINNVVIDNEFTGGSSTPVYGDVKTDVPDTFNFLLGSQLDWGGKLNWHFGFVFAIPADKVFEPATKDSYQPQYATYMSDSQRMTLGMATSFKAADSLSFGFGVNYFLLAGANLTARLPVDGATQKTSTANLKMNVKPAISPLAGVAWRPNDADSWSLNYEGVRDHKVATTFQSEMDVGVVKPTIVVDSSASMFYDPETLSLGYAHDYGSGDFLVGVDYERWSRFLGSYLKLDVKQGSNWVQYPLDSNYHDTWVPRVGFTHRFGEDRWSLGYAFKPSPTPSLEKQTNFVDSDRHIVGTGYEVDTRIFGLLDRPVKFDFHLQAHYLIPKDIKKDNPTDIGGPGYQVKGWVFSYGVNLNVKM